MVAEEVQSKLVDEVGVGQVPETLAPAMLARFVVGMKLRITRFDVCVDPRRLFSMVCTGNR